MSVGVVSPLARWFRLLLAGLLLFALGGCASLSGHDPLNIHVVGLDPLPGEGLEMRFALKLRVQNPNDFELPYEGVAVELRVNDHPLASGVSAERGSVPRFGETLLVVPVSISALAAARQALGLAEHERLDRVPYVLRGKLGGAPLGRRRFSDTGTFDLGALGRVSR